jgi:hypothetical protein
MGWSDTLWQSHNEIGFIDLSLAFASECLVQTSR